MRRPLPGGRSAKRGPFRAAASGYRPGIGGTRSEYSDLFGVYWPIGLAVLVLVVAAVLFTVMRFRSREHGLPRGRDKNTPAEAAYAAVIAGIVALLVYLTFNSMSDLEAAEGRAELDVAVTASRWNWRFEYSGHGVVRQGTRTRIPTLVVPVDTPVRFTQTSRDVIHSFWIPELRFKRDAFPGRETAFTLRFPREGFLRQAGVCAEFCGLDHASMAFNVEVLPRARFTRWLRDEAARR